MHDLHSRLLIDLYNKYEELKKLITGSDDEIKESQGIQFDESFQESPNLFSEEEDIRGMYVRIPFSLYKKLKAELLKRRMPMSKWIHERIEEIQ